MLDKILNLVLTCLCIFLPPFFMWLAAKLKRAAVQVLNTEEKQAVAKTVVAAVEQMFKDLHGKDKLMRAVDMMDAMLVSKGINIDENEIKIFLESAVGEWNKAIKAVDVFNENVEVVEK